MRRPDTLIVGGGPAGAAAAIGLAQAGAAPLVLERSQEPADHLCGGFLSWTALKRLERLGVDVAALGARPITRLALFLKRRELVAALPAPAASLSRRALDMALLERAEAAGAIIARGVRVRRIDGQGATLEDGGELAATRIVLASGKHELASHRRGATGGDPVLGLRWRLTASPPLTRRLENAIELHAFAGGYAGLALQEDGRANLCLAVRQSRFAEAGKRPDRLLEALARELPALAARLGEATAIAPPDAVARIPYGWRARAGGDPSLYRVGDQAGVIASLAGEGISLALAGGEAAARAVLAREGPKRFQGRLARRLHRPIAVAQQMMHGLEHPAGAWLLLGAARTLPSSLGLTANATRLASDAI